MSRLFFPMFQLLVPQARAHKDAAPPASAKQATRCGVLLLKLGGTDREPSPESKRVVETVPARLFARSGELGATRSMQEAWIAQFRLQMAAATQEQRKRQLRLEWPQCLGLIREEAVQLPALHGLGRPY
jgi:hypothetical protein